MASTAPSRTTAAVEDLVAQLVPGLPSDDPRNARLVQLCLRITASRISSGPLTESAVGERTRRKLLQAGRAADALDYSELVGQLTHTDHGLRELPSALQLLTALLHSSNKPAGLPVGGALLRPSEVAAPPSTVATGSVQAPEPDPTPPSSRTVDTRAADANGSGGARMRRWEVSGSDGVLTEETLVRELLFVMQNIDGKHLKWDAERDAFVLPRTASVPPGARQLTGRLAELGWLFRQVQSYVRSGDEVMSDGAKGGGGREGTSERGGLVPQALRHALQSELDEWYQLLAVLEAQVTLPPLCPALTHPTPSRPDPRSTAPTCTRLPWVLGRSVRRSLRCCSCSYGVGNRCSVSS